jgi:tRNA U34 5-carboxymethylaminomethyl modifying enzyme MnmG/GidA
MKKNSQALLLVGILAALSGCASTTKVVVDPKSVTDGAKYSRDLNECTNLANTFDLSADTTKNAALGAAAGGVAVAGVATAVAGAIFWPAIPFIAAGTLLGGGTAGGMTNSDQGKARERILADCLTDRGYKAYRPS